MHAVVKLSIEDTRRDVSKTRAETWWFSFKFSSYLARLLLPFECRPERTQIDVFVAKVLIQYALMAISELRVRATQVTFCAEQLLPAPIYRFAIYFYSVRNNTERYRREIFGLNVFCFENRAEFVRTAEQPNGLKM